MGQRGKSESPWEVEASTNNYNYEGSYLAPLPQSTVRSSTPQINYSVNQINQLGN